MKKILFVFALPFLAACSNDDPMVDERTIAGSWYETAFMYEGKFSPVENGRSYHFKNDMTYIFDDGFLKESGSYSTEANTRIVHLVTSEGNKRTIAITFSDAEHAEFKSPERTSKYERR